MALQQLQQSQQQQLGGLVASLGYVLRKVGKLMQKTPRRQVIQESIWVAQELLVELTGLPVPPMAQPAGRQLLVALARADFGKEAGKGKGKGKKVAQQGGKGEGQLREDGKVAEKSKVVNDAAQEKELVGDINSGGQTLPVSQTAAAVGGRRCRWPRRGNSSWPRRRCRSSS